MPRLCSAKCGAELPRGNSLVKACSPQCALTLARASREKKDRKVAAMVNRAEKVIRAKLRADKARIKTRAQWMKEAQTAFNAWIRERDRNEPCISCHRHHNGQYHAGHYRSVGSNPSIRFDPLNAHKQCQPCNSHLSGNAIEYRISLLVKIGERGVAFLEGPHEPKKYTIPDLIEIKAKYTQMRKNLEMDRL